MFHCADQTAVINALGTENFFVALVNLLARDFTFDSSSAIAYNKDKPPELLYADLPEHEATKFYASFLDGAYVASPAYQGVVNNYSDGVYPWVTLMPEGFKASQLYVTYYQPSCIEDLVYFFINSEALGYIQFCLGRHTPNRGFSTAELSQLAQLGPLMSALICKHGELASPQKAQPILPLSSIVSARVTYLLDNFEAELLTLREREIAKLVITGHSSQSAADVLNISPGTERVHRAKLYAKLKLRSSSELFSYFLAKLTQLN
jgi:DNA-binding CsgD family transcriptional regulator